MKYMTNRRIVLIAGIVLGLVIIGFAAAAYAPAADERDTGSNRENAENNETPKTEKQYVGELVCLPHKGSPEVTTMECAGGLKDADGQYYGLTDANTDGNNMAEYMTLPFGEQVVVTGIFEEAEGSVYDTIGTIRVSSAQKQE